MRKLTDVLSKIDQLQSDIDGHGQLDTELAKRIQYKFRLDWNHYSNAMEGNSLTRIETKQLMMDNVTIDGKPFKDITEMRGHDNEVLEIFKVGKGQVRLSEKRIKSMHRAIMHEDDPTKKEFIGIWKTVNNNLINYKGEKYDFLPFDEVPYAIHSLINNTNAAIDALENAKQASKHPVQIAFEFHLEYIRIHPFYDGNGRTARLLTNLLLISFGYPPFLLSEQSRKSYYRILGEVQGYGGDVNDFHVLLGELLIESQELVLKAISGKDISEENDVDKEILLWKQSLDIKDAVVIEKTDSIIAKTYFDSIRPVFELFINKYKLFQDLFVSQEVHNMIGDQWWEVNELEFFDSWAINNLKKKDKSVDLIKVTNYISSSNYNFDNVGPIHQIRLDVRLFGFKKNGINLFNSEDSLLFNFKVNTYELVNLKSEKGEKYEKLYSESFRSNEITNIVNQKTKSFLEKLKIKTQN